MPVPVRYYYDSGVTAATSSTTAGRMPSLKHHLRFRFSRRDRYSRLACSPSRTPPLPASAPPAASTAVVTTTPTALATTVSAPENADYFCDYPGEAPRSHTPYPSPTLPTRCPLASRKHHCPPITTDFDEVLDGFRRMPPVDEEYEKAHLYLFSEEMIEFQ